MMINVLTITKQ